MRELLPVLLLVACDGGGDKCPDDEKVLAFEDLDGDGWGVDRIGLVCQLADNMADQEGDCDDADAAVHPEAKEKCNGVDDDCDLSLDEDFDSIKPFYPDGDGDGFGVPGDTVAACQAPDGYANNDTDCDDSNAAVNPDSAEVCNDGLDDDCNQLADAADPYVDPTSLSTWYPDVDMDGFGKAGGVSAQSCVAPPGAVDNDLDCDDTDDTIHPNGVEVCNNADDDCDTLTDEEDPDLDPAELVNLFADSDGDGTGDPNVLVAACDPQPGIGVEDDTDCDDSNPQVSPNLNEVPCDTFDNDCDPATNDDSDFDLDGYFRCVDDCDDQEPLRNPGMAETPADGFDSNCDLLEDCYADVDLDGARNDTTVAVLDPFCDDAGNLPPTATLDCDDSDPYVTWSGQWVADGDLDGFGAGDVVLVQCTDPGVGYALLEAVPDCDDADANVYPDAPTDACNDGVDGDCDGIDTCESCKAWIDSDPTLPSGVTLIRPDGGDEIEVWCDHDTDGGGWTLVASTALDTLNDIGAGWHEDLITLEPAGAHPGIWAGMRPVVTANADLRFTCKLDLADPVMTVDLSFYDVPWYTEITGSADAQSCFSPAGAPEPAPARRDNVSGISLTVGDEWDNGGLVGEDTCGDTDDFTVDLDDRGMDGDEGDGTDWGEDDSKPKCGASNAGQAWFIFVRER